MRNALDDLGNALEEWLDAAIADMKAKDAEQDERLDALEKALEDLPEPGPGDPDPVDPDPVDPDPDPVDPDPGDGDDPYAETARDFGALAILTNSDGAFLYDESGNGLHGEMAYASWSPTGGPGDHLPGYVVLDGQGHIDMGLAPEFGFKRDHAFVWWERGGAEQANAHADRFSKGNNSYHVRTPSRTGHRLSYTLRHSPDSGGVVLESRDQAVAGTHWQMFAATYDGSYARLYEVSASGAHLIGSVEYNQDLYREAGERFIIGGRSINGGSAVDRFWKGQMAGVVVFDRAVGEDVIGALYDAAKPHAPPAAPEPPAPADLDLRVDRDFHITDLDNTKKDQYGLTTREWYQRMLAEMPKHTDFGRDSWRPWNRTGKQHVVAMLSVMRHTGDQALLDEAVRLVKRQWSRRTRIDGHLTFAGYDQAIDALLGGGLFAVVMYACHLNRGLTSPAGHNYGALADEIRDWFVTDFLPKWDTTGKVYFQTRYQQHTYASAHIILWYLSKMPGSQYKNRTPAVMRQAVHDYVADKLKGDRVGPIGRNGRMVRLWSHTVFHRASSSSAGRHLQFSTYTGGEISTYHDMYLEGIPGFDRPFFETMAAAFADFVCDDAANGADTPFARTIAGDRMAPTFDCSKGGGRDTDIRVLTLPYDHCYRTRMPYHRPPSNSTHLLSAWDQDNRMGPYIHAQYEISRRNTSRFHGFPTCQVFNSLHHGVR